MPEQTGLDVGEYNGRKEGEILAFGLEPVDEISADKSIRALRASETMLPT